MRVGLFQQVFPHYRSGTLASMIEIKEIDWVLFGCSDEPKDPGILKWRPPQCIDIKRIYFFDFFGLRIHLNLISMLFYQLDKVILVGNAKWPALWLISALFRLRGVEVIFWSHGWLSDERSLKAKLRLMFYKLSHTILLYDNKAARIMREKGYTGNVHVVYNSVNRKYKIDLSNDVERSYNIPSDRNYLISVARLVPNRKYELLFDALRGTNVPLLLVGSGPSEQALKQLAIKNNIYVKFLGSVYDEKVLERLYEKAFASVIPGRIGLSAIQSLQNGTPVITHSDADDQHPEFEVLIDNYNSFLFDKRSVNYLRECIKSAENKGATLQENCINSVEKYDPSYQKTIFEKVLKHSI